jgi:hypothetical protein
MLISPSRQNQTPFASNRRNNQFFTASCPRNLVHETSSTKPHETFPSETFPSVHETFETFDHAAIAKPDQRGQPSAKLMVRRFYPQESRAISETLAAISLSILNK